MKPPARLTGDARKKWTEIGNSFDLRSPLNAELLAQFCEAFGMYERARKELDSVDVLVNTAPNGAMYQHPDIAVMIKCSDQMARRTKNLEQCRVTDDAVEEELI
jgi:phage terminase small subunit